MDRSWMYERLDPSRRLSQQFITGVIEFVSKAMNQDFYTLDGGIRCPCIKCVCEKILPPSHVRAYLLQYGFRPNYIVWVQHGEEMSSEDNDGYASSSHGRTKPINNVGSMTSMVYDAYIQEADITSHYGDMDKNNEYVEESPNVEAQRFYDMLAAANEPIYDGATESKLSIAIKLLAARTNWHTPEKCLDYFIKLLVDVAPKDNCIPKSYYDAKKVVSSLGLKAQKIDCCEAGCMLYYKGDNYLKECKFCHLPRYFPSKGDIQLKRMFYLPIISRLQRVYASMESVKQMRWHFENKKDGILRHHVMGWLGSTLIRYIQILLLTHDM